MEPRLDQIDDMIDFAVARVSESPQGPRLVVADLARYWPDASGLQYVFVMVSAAHAIEQVFHSEEMERNEVSETLRMAALLGADLFALQQRGSLSPTGRELLTYWKEVDGFFLAS